MLFLHKHLISLKNDPLHNRNRFAESGYDMDVYAEGSEELQVRPRISRESCNMAIANYQLSHFPPHCASPQLFRSQS